MSPTILYIIYHKEYHAIKVGIGDIAGKRFKAHRAKGWVLVKYWYFGDRKQALAVEEAVLQELRKITKTEHFLNKEHMPQHGYTETFSTKRISRRKVINLINRYTKQML